MKEWKLRQITRVREAVRLLRRDAHLELCDCCRADLDLIEECADSACAEAWLRQVAKRVELSRQGPWRATVSGSRPPRDGEA